MQLGSLMLPVCNSTGADHHVRLVFRCAQRPTETQTHTNTLRAASTYRPAVLTDPMTSFSSSSSSTLLSFSSFTGVSFNTPPVLLPSRWTCHLHSFPYFPKSRVSSDSKGLVLCSPQISSAKKIRNKKKNQCLPTTLSLMWLYIDNGYLFFIPLILHHVLEEMYSSLKRCSLLCASLFYLLVALWEFGIMKSADRSLDSKDSRQ